jgi:hypothetical protein
MHICELEDAGIMLLTGSKMYQSPDGKLQMGSIDRSFLCCACQGERQVSDHDLAPLTRFPTLLAASCTSNIAQTRH